MFGLTLAVITGVGLLLPGFFGILMWNLPARRQLVSGPDLPINTLNVPTLGIALAMIAHFFTGGLIQLFQTLCIEIGRLWGPKGFTLYPAINPVEMMLVLIRGGEQASTLSTAKVVPGFIAPLISKFCELGVMADDGVDMATEGWDKPVVSMPQHDRQLLSEVDVRRLIEVLAVSTLFL